MMSDRFDLEQGILTCWHITDDIQLLIDQNAPPEAYKALITMYNYKFENLWQIFEHMVHTVY